MNIKICKKCPNFELRSYGLFCHNDVFSIDLCQYNNNYVIALEKLKHISLKSDSDKCPFYFEQLLNDKKKKKNYKFLIYFLICINNIIVFLYNAIYLCDVPKKYSNHSSPRCSLNSDEKRFLFVSIIFFPYYLLFLFISIFLYLKSKIKAKIIYLYENSEQ